MFRFVVTCVILAAVCVTAVVFLGQGVWHPGGARGDTKPGQGPGSAAREQPSEPGDRPRPAETDTERPRASTTESPARLIELAAATGTAAPVIIQDARVLPAQRQDVPSERDGKLLFLATPIAPGEVVPKDKLVTYEVSLLAIKVHSWAGIPEAERLRDDADPKQLYRRVRPTDDLAPVETAIIRQKLRFRRLDVGDKVAEGQVLGVINPVLALEDVAIKQAKVAGAEADAESTVGMKEESERRYDTIKRLKATGGRGIVSLDDEGLAKASVQRYQQEVVAKRAAIRQAQRELSAAWTTLEMYMLRASIPGVIKTVYRQQGEAVKNLEAVLQIQNPDKLRVEAQMEVQDAQPLRNRLLQAQAYYREADRLCREALLKNQPDEPSAAKTLRAMADGLVSVLVEVSRLEPPRTALAGHLQEVTCVAVTKGPLPRIVSGSEDHTVRIWERIPGEDRWQERARLDHHAAVRAVACTGPTAAKSLLLTGTATGRARLFDMNDLKAGERVLKERHSGPICAVAFSPDGKLCATGGEDRAICLYDTETGEVLSRVSGAHKQRVTSLVFTSKGQLVSAGKDRRLVVWDVKEGGKTLAQADEPFGRRSGEVDMLGVDPTGEQVLFDEGRELRLMSLKSHKIEGTLVNPPATPSFATMALYSPDGKTILTNGNAQGRLQLWRAPSSKTRAAELRNYVWSNGLVNCGAFDPAGEFIVTGTSDGRVVIWDMPGKEEAQEAMKAQLSYVEEFLDTSLKKVTVRATLDNPGWVIPGGHATLIVPPRVSRDKVPAGK